MRVFFPSYYKEFRCIADRCRHSCCVGWEIFVDEGAMARFSATGGALGDEIRKNITPDGMIRLTECERCPFLDERGLCRMISEKGDSFVPAICQEHPRFYHRVGDRLEGGIGMSCEEAARIILSSDDFFSMMELDREIEAADETDFDTLTHRKLIYSILADESLDFSARVKRIREEYSIPDPKVEPLRWRDALSSLEYLNEENAELFSVGRSEKCIENYKYLTRFLAYLVLRHVSIADSRDNLRARVGFSLLLTAILEDMLSERELSFDGICESARRISEEIEYSEDNTASLIFEFEAEI